MRRPNPVSRLKTEGAPFGCPLLAGNGAQWLQLAQCPPPQPPQPPPWLDATTGLPPLPLLTVAQVDITRWASEPSQRGQASGLPDSPIALRASNLLLQLGHWYS